MNKFVLLLLLPSLALASGGGPIGGGSSGNATSIQGTPVSAVAPTLNQFLKFDGTNWAPATLSASGTVTSVGLSLPSLFTVTNSPVTTTGILTATLNTQTANTVWSGPSSGVAAAPTFRSLVAADIPSLSSVYVPVTRTVSTTAPLSGGGALSSNLTLSIPVATSSANGYLSSGDWSTFNGKQAALTLGNLTSPTTGVSVSGGTGAVIGSGAAVSIQNATTAQPGLLTAADWNTFNSKQASGSYLTALTGDVVATGPGSSAATIQALAVTNAKIANSTIDLTAKVTGVLPTANGGTGTATNFTAGSLVFAGASGPYAQDNANLFWDATNHRLGIGTATPAFGFDIVQDTSVATQVIQQTGYGANSIGWRGRHARGTSASPTATQSGDFLSFISGRGYGSTGFASAATGNVSILATANFTDSSMPTALTFSVTPAASVTTAEALRIAPTGNLLIGTTTDDATDKLQVSGTISSGAQVITSSSANSFAVGQNGTTNPAFLVDSSTATSVTGIKITSTASGAGVTLSANSSNANERLNLQSRGTGNIDLTTPSSGNIRFVLSGGTKFTVSGSQFSFTPSATNTAGNARFLYTAPSDSALTASSEAPEVFYDLSQTRTHSTGALAMQRDFRINNSTQAFVGASALTEAATLSIDGPPIGGANATVTNSSAIYVPTSACANTTNCYGLSVAAATGASNNYAARFTGGNTGFGLSAPSSLVHLDGGTATATALKITEGSTTGTTSTDGFDIGGDSSGNAELRQRENLIMSFFTNNTKRVLIAAAGQLSAQLGGTTTLMGVNTGSYVNTTTTGNTAATETDAFSHSIAANTLATNGDTIDFKSAGTFATSVSTDKRIRVKFGATTVFDSGALAITTSAPWTVSGQCIRTGAATQKCFVSFQSGSTVLSSSAGYSTAAETLSGAVTMKLTIQGTLANDVVAEMYKETWLPGT